MTNVLLQRLCWNTNQWRSPTGSALDGGYPQQNGFGHEEWNFQAEDSFDGFIYGYLYYKPATETLALAGGAFDIAFWARHPYTKRDLLVGRYEEAVRPSSADYAALEAAWTASKVYERRAHELSAAVPTVSLDSALTEVRVATRQHEMFKCRVDKLLVLQTAIDITDKIRSYRFTNPTALGLPWSTLVDGESHILEPNSPITPLAEDAYAREIGARQQIILRRHQALSNRLAAWLRERGVNDVQQEVGAVDIQFKSGGALSRVEIKTTFSTPTTLAIREAIGQLLEYNFYGVREPADRWAIVLDREPNERDKHYIQRLNNVLKIPLNLGWESETGFHFLTELK